MKVWLRLVLLAVPLFAAVANGKVLDSLVIEGLSINSPAMVRNTIEVRTGQQFTITDIQESIRRLAEQGLFRKTDFYVLSENDTAASLKLVVDEYPICDTVEYHGNKKLKKKDFEEKVALKRGQIVTDAQLYNFKKKIRSLYLEKGYNLAEVAVELVPSKVPGNVIVTATIKENARVRIKSITFLGNHAIKSSKLEGKFKTKKSAWFRSGEFKRDEYESNLDTLILYYNDLGYLDASVVKDSVWYGQDKKELYIQIALDEGKQYFVGDFFFKGNTVIPTDSLAKKVDLKAGKPFQKNRFDLSKYMVENAYREEGFLWVQVADQRTYRGDTIDVTFDVYEGRSAIVHKVDIRGNTKTMEKVVRREIDLLPGKKYKQSLMMRSRQKVLALNYFSDVKPDLVPNNDGTIDMVFDVTEKDNIGQLQVGAAYSGYNGFIGTFSTSIPNFRGAGQELGVNVEYGDRTQNIALRFVEPWAFERPIMLSGQIFYRKNSYYAYQANEGYGFILGSGLSKMQWPDDHFQLSGAYQFSFERGSIPYVGSVPEYGLNLASEGFLSRLTLTLSRYDLDMPMFPSSGSRLTVSPEIAGIGADFHYLKNSVGYEHYFPLPFKFVFGTRAKAGQISALGGDIKISQFDLFKLGGLLYSDAELRGYDDVEFGGLSGRGSRDYGRPENGLAMFATTLELRYPLLEQQLYLGLFADGGNCWPSLSEFNPLDLYKSIGVGLRINVPMLGLMGLDFGWGLDDPTPDGFKTKPSGFKLGFTMNRGF